MSIFNILKGIGGDVEIGRVSLVFGGFFAVFSPIVFEAWEMGWKGGHFDVTAWCLAYPAGLVTLVTGGIYAIGNKEKQVASAQVVRDTGSLPGVGVTDEPQEVKVTNTAANPVPVKDKT